MSSTNDLDAFLNDLLKSLSAQEGLKRERCEYLATLFTPAIDSHVRAKAFVALSAVTEHCRHLNARNDDESGTHNIVHAFQSSIDAKLAEVEEMPLLEVLSFVTALMAVDWRAGSSLFVRDGFQDSMMDAMDLFPSSQDMQTVIAALLAASSGYKNCRACMSSRCTAWLEIASRDTDLKLKSTASLALLKLSQGGESDDESITRLADSFSGQVERQASLFATFRDTLVVSDGQLSSLIEVIEGLAYLSTNPICKERISNDTELLSKLSSLEKSLQKRYARKEDLGTAPFGLASLISNLASYRPKLSGEQEQITKLKRMAQAKASLSDQDAGTDLDTDDHVRLRAKRLVDVGAAELLVAISQIAESAVTRAVVGSAFLGLIEDKPNRGRILQAGGAKALASVIRASQYKDANSSDPLSKAEMNFTDLGAIQALAKLAITSSPLQVFGPNENTSIEAIKPFACLLLHASSTLLQRFEALMALTNISSSGPSLADRIARTDGILSKLEFLLLDDNVMVRRAAAELVCNLVSGSEHAFNRCTGEGSDQDKKMSENQAKSRLHVLFALSDVEDEPTRLAASGALAVLTGSPSACRLITLLEVEHHRVFLILKGLLNPLPNEGTEGDAPKDPQGLMHRGVVCVRNLLCNVADDGGVKDQLLAEAVSQGIIDALANLFKSGQDSLPAYILQPTAEALKWLVENGSNLLR